MNLSLNWLAILVSAVVAMVIGSVWYGPLFGKKYMAAVGMDAWPPEKKAAMRKVMFKSYALQFIASLLMFFVLAANIAWNGLGAVPAMVFAFFMWLGFVLPLKLGDAIWSGSWTLFWLGLGQNLITLLAAGAILGGWK